MPKDISMTDDGSFTVEGGDFVIAEPEQVDRQIINTRVKTFNPDFYYNQAVGADLEELMGLENNEETAEQGRLNILHCLTFDKRFGEGQIMVDYAPIDYNTIMFFLLLETSRHLAENEPIAVGLYLKSGVVE